MKINDVALTEIAHEAGKKEKRDLAKKLLEKETSISRKIPVLVWMKEYLSSLEEAFYGKDTNMIILVLIKFFTLANPPERRSMYEKCLKMSPELTTQLINYLKRTGKKEYLAEFYETCKGTELSQFELVNTAATPLIKIPDALQSPAAELLRNRMVELRKCKDTAEASKDKDLVGALENEIKVVDYHLKDPASTSQSVDKFKVLAH